MSLYTSNTVVLNNTQSNWRWSLIERQIHLSIAMGLTPDATYHLFDRLPSPPRSHLANWMRLQGYVIDQPHARHYGLPVDENEAPAPNGPSQKTENSRAFSSQFLQDSAFLSKFDSVFGLSSAENNQPVEAAPVDDDATMHNESPAARITDHPNDYHDDAPSNALSASPAAPSLAKQSFSKIRQLLS